MADKDVTVALDVAIAESVAKIEKLRFKTSTESPNALPPWWSNADAMTMSSVVLIFGFITMVLASWLLRVGKEPEAVLRVFGTILILVATIFLIVAGYSSTQIAPAMGLLGTIAGYLLGKADRKSEVGTAPKVAKSDAG